MGAFSFWMNGVEVKNCTDICKNATSKQIKLEVPVAQVINLFEKSIKSLSKRDLLPLFVEKL